MRGFTWLADRFFLTRPTLYLPGWVAFFAGAFWGLGLPVFGATWSMPRGFWLAIASYTLLMAPFYILNQIQDAESDRLNKKLFLIPEGIVSVRSAKVQAWLLFLGSAALLPWTSRDFALVWLLSVALAWLYNGPPAMKGNFLMSVTLNATGYGAVAFWAGWASVSPLSAEALLRAVPYVLGVAASALNTMIPDIPGDRAAGQRTVATELGPRRTAWLALAADLGALGSGLWLRDPWISTAALLGAPLFLRAALNPSDPAVKASYRLGSAGLGALLALRFPPLLLGAIAVLGASRLYYSRRFGLKYPSITR